MRDLVGSLDSKSEFSRGTEQSLGTNSPSLGAEKLLEIRTLGTLEKLASLSPFACGLAFLLDLGVFLHFLEGEGF